MGISLPSPRRAHETEMPISSVDVVTRASGAGQRRHVALDRPPMA